VLTESSTGLNDAFVDLNLRFIIAQKSDLNASISGIKEYNKLKGRVETMIENKHDNVTRIKIEIVKPNDILQPAKAA
jgi:hypothetical protein